MRSPENKSAITLLSTILGELIVDEKAEFDLGTIRVCVKVKNEYGNIKCASKNKADIWQFDSEVNW